MMASNVTQGSGAHYNTVDHSLADFSDGPPPDSQPWDTSDPFFSASTRDLLQRVLKCYVRQPIVFVGILGNILCCAVFLKQGLSDRIHLLLFWLAVADLTSLLTQLLLMPGCYLMDPLQVANWDVIVNTKIASVTWWLTNVSGTLVLLLSVDRCLSVVVPFKAKRLLQYRLTVAAMFVSYLLPLMFAVLRFLAFTVVWRTDPLTNHSVAFSTPTSWFLMDHMLAANLMFYFSFVTKPVFLVTMIICCSITILHLRKASRKRVKMGGNVTEEARSGDNRITIMLLVICCAYIIFSIPEVASAFTVMLVPEFSVYKQYHNSAIVQAQFLWIASCLNSAINFFPYLLLSSRFQRTLQGLFSCPANRNKTVM